MNDHQMDKNTDESRLNYVLTASGFAIAERFADEATLAKIEEIAFSYEAELDEFVRQGGKLDSLAGHPLKNARAMYCVDPIFQSLVMDKGIFDIASRYLEAAELRDCHLLVNNPDKRNAQRGRGGKVNWHRDGKWSDGETVSRFLHCFLLLSDFTNQNGGTIVVPGTHNLKEPEYYFIETDPGEAVEGNYYKVYPQDYFPAGIQITARRGDLVVFDPMCIHAQGINVTDERRSVINFSFQKAGTPPLFDCKTIAERQARYTLSAEFYDILATGDGAPNTYGPVL